MPRSKSTAKTTTAKDEPIALKYVGEGAFIPGVPAADHTVDSQKEADRLVESGLYKVTTAKPDQGEGA